jgi:hypothetical protein
MANKVVIDSKMPIGAKQVQVAAAGTDPTLVPKVNDLIRVGGKCGLISAAPRQGEDGAWWSTVDVWAVIRLDAVTGAFTDGQPVYVTSGGAITGTATGNFCIGYADGAKTATGAGILRVQLIPSATGA